MTAIATGTRCECEGQCDRVKAFAPGHKGHRYPGRCMNAHLTPTKTDVPRKVAVLELIENRGNGAKRAVCQWCKPVFLDPTLLKPKAR
jgi:hypothetical protein